MKIKHPANIENLLELTFYYKYDQGSANYIEEYIENVLLKSLSDPSQVRRL